MINLYNYTKNQLTAEMQKLNVPSFRAIQIFNWLYKSKIARIDDMNNIPAALRLQLKKEYEILLPETVEIQKSIDETIKYLLVLTDNYSIETVLIPDVKHDTICLSSQVGCPLACTYCVTGHLGFVRNLTTSEIIGQLILTIKTLPLNRKINMVFMGMGEPLLNLKNVMDSISIMTDKDGLGLSMRNITLSTIGYPPGIKELSTYSLLPKIALSLNSANDTVRAQLMPFAKKFPLTDIINSLQTLPIKKGRRITLEYIMIKGINDSIQDAHTLIKLMKKIPSKVNLIPFNETPQIPFEASTNTQIETFASCLRKHNLTVTVRTSRGKDISAACGMLKFQRKM
ncbi:MAG: 23S rRNA (adenine(2503)-C(2))-methyltransferase [Candidatus Fischerbacteria bacterium RBG_13_37_8]|uniref:Probable dual-specificity RNA methyltransferase RlmN n=1 Tax=Candidatus Fischerbacteria bacterium RBG_13_37_8 TaxID=1817863 RepID=A0A1F5VY83_9BACT|nr:MAG: 23S rRNA (adenine(2503)-C(2))-methyltransferase [Candidatus Fischerbacteria bacterium RBG_13_37_8]